jgi:hypothetical protein
VNTSGLATIEETQHLPEVALKAAGRQQGAKYDARRAAASFRVAGNPATLLWQPST